MTDEDPLYTILRDKFAGYLLLTVCVAFCAGMYIGIVIEKRITETGNEQTTSVTRTQ